MKLYKSFRLINQEEGKIINLFKGKSDLLAHTQISKASETLHQHISSVKKYFLILVNKNGLEPVIDNIINSIALENDKIANLIKELFFLSIIFHDFGKTNPNFQSEKMQNQRYKKNKSLKIGFEHSFLSAYFFINYCVYKISQLDFSNDERIKTYVFTFLFSIPILKHHSGFIEKDYNFSAEKINSIHHLTEVLNLQINKEQISNLFKYENSKEDKNLWLVFNNLIQDKNFDFFPLFVLLKLNYSLLTASDYLATSEYMNDIKLETEVDFGLISERMKERLFINFDNNNKTPWNGELFKDKEFFLYKSLDDLHEKSFVNLNFIRQKLGADVLKNIEENKNQKVFYIEAPTGGGKTNMSMIAVRKLIELQPELNKVFYVFPFTTLITQTAQVIKETFGLSDSEIAQVHSKAGFKTREYENAKYGKAMRNQIDNLFINYPFTLLTHIKFFDILKSNKKSDNYLLHRLANSIVIIDELQSYPPEHWDKIKYYISHYAGLFNIRFIIMSATLPRIDKIKNIFNTHFEPLIPNAKQYLQNENFSKRVEIRTDLLRKNHINLPELATIVEEKSKEYATNRIDEFKNSVYTIVEFIYKKTASNFFEIISGLNENFFDEIFVLSGTILEPRKRFIIEYLKDDNNRKKKVLLITTQVVEAGVDIDMDLGFKNQSLIDSDEQLAGRINRNLRKTNCKLWLFKHDNPSLIYGNDLRYSVTDNYSTHDIKDILNNKDFGRLYTDVFNEIEKKNNSVWQSNFTDYLKTIELLNFYEVHNTFKLIDSNNVTIFVPIDVDINCYKRTDNFSADDINFVRKHNCLNYENPKQISGEKIWKLYFSIIKNEEINFLKKKIELKILNGIMSKFVFSVFIKSIDNLKPYLDNNIEFDNYKEFQYFKLLPSEIGEDKIYSFEGGLNETKSKELFEIF